MPNKSYSSASPSSIPATAENVENERSAQNDRPRVLLLGEQNPYGGDPEMALYPHPDGSAGQRLAEVVLGLKRADYLRRFDRANVLDRGGRWSAPEAREAAARKVFGRHRVVALGAKVAAALRLPTTPFVEHEVPLPGFGTRRVLVLPHPSGLCRVWNEPGAHERARALVFALEARS